MKEWNEENLLQLPEVVEEIRRHLWIESEKAGRDVGFEWAKQDWIKKYAKAWLAHNKPSAKNLAFLFTDNGKKKKRSAKSYLF